LRGTIGLFYKTRDWLGTLRFDGESVKAMFYGRGGHVNTVEGYRIFHVTKSAPIAWWWGDSVLMSRSGNGTRAGGKSVQLSCSIDSPAPRRGAGLIAIVSGGGADSPPPKFQCHSVAAPQYYPITDRLVPRGLLQRSADLSSRRVCAQSQWERAPTSFRSPQLTRQRRRKGKNEYRV
jgi:hypothetical protein